MVSWSLSEGFVVFLVPVKHFQVFKSKFSSLKNFLHDGIRSVGCNEIWHVDVHVSWTSNLWTRYWNPSGHIHTHSPTLLCWTWFWWNSHTVMSSMLQHRVLTYTQKVSPIGRIFTIPRELIYTIGANIENIFCDDQFFRRWTSPALWRSWDSV